MEEESPFFGIGAGDGVAASAPRGWGAVAGLKAAVGSAVYPLSAQVLLWLPTEVLTAHDDSR